MTIHRFIAAFLLVASTSFVAQAETLRVDGLAAPVEILVDRWGVAHIYAENESDLFFAQGFNAARDRLFQFEIWRRQATGTTAEILGRKALQRDIGARLLKFRGDMDRELAHYHPRGQLIIESFVAGVNAYIGLTEENPDLLPVEFSLLEITPGRWTPEVVVSRHQGLYGNIGAELRYAQALRVLGPDRLKELANFHPGDPDLTVDAKVDLSLISERILETYAAHRSPLRFEPDDIVTAHRGDPAAAALLAERIDAARMRDEQRFDIGSNNWTVAGRLTQSGKPIMANDPHRTQAAPSLRYWVHLVAPGWNVIGGGEPVLPGVSIGHNERGAWGLTVFGVDIEDLYVYETNPDRPSQYRYLGGWEDMTVRTETIAIEDEAPVTVDVKYTRHGPVLYEDPERHTAYALRAAWLEIGAAPYLASLRMDQAQTWEEFREACSYSRTPAENMVWADVDGNIGWQAVGVPPLRKNFSGLIPVPGDGRYEWDGFLPGKALPHVINPDKGFWATANNNLVPPGYPHRHALAWNWTDPYRAARAEELLASGRRHSVGDMMRTQHDELSIPARTLLPLLDSIEPDDDLVEVMFVLRDWDHVLDRRSIGAGIYVAWERRLRQNVWAASVPSEARAFIRSVPMSKMIDWLMAPDGRFGDDPVADRDALLVRSLREALTDLTEKLGPDRSQWHYGQAAYKHAVIRHSMSGAVSEPTRARLDVGPLPRGGNSYTLNNTSGGDNQSSGASFRIVADTSNWDNSVGTNNPGQSGNPDSPHYRDLFELWARGKYFPVFYSREKIESVVERVDRLEP